MPCVVLIDEYDDPVARALANPAEAELDEYFGEHMAAHAKVMGLADDAYRAELKRDGTADEALAQIREKGYAAPYLADGRPVWAVGLAFDSQTRQLVDAKEAHLA